MISKSFNQIQLEVTSGNIVRQTDMEAIVNAANAELRMGGGVAGAIHRTAGPQLEQECWDLAPIRPGEAVITGAYQLPNKYVIHCLGPIYGVDRPEDRLLADCYRNALRLADREKIRSIAFPAISTGAFGYPIEAAVDVAINTIVDTLPELKYVSKIRLVLFNEEDYSVYEKRVKALQ